LRYQTHSDSDLREILAAIGVESTEALFDSIPEDLRLRGDLPIPGPLSEVELDRELRALAARNRHAASGPSFLGAGAYHHYIPAIVDHLIQRGEFLTAYTPYQAEMSQGTLQAIFEFQTLICQLTEMEVANASLYDGATATAEAVFMAQRLQGRSRILISETLHPHYRQVVWSLAANLGLDLTPVPRGGDGRTEAAALAGAAGGDLAAVVVQSPNFFGCIEDLEAAARVARGCGALLIVVVAEGISLGLLAGPGRFGADLVVGEGQSFGLPLSYGGPYLGLMATRERFVRQMPGRLAGEAYDAEGRRGFVLTLSTREQHIRRERATSNICTNQGLCALTAAIYLSTLGRRGLRLVARRNLDAASWARRRLAAVRGCALPFAAPTFHEFVLRLPGPAAAWRRRMAERGILGGLPLGPYDRGLEDCMLICCTELTRRDDVEALARCLEEGGR
jgi:glycine dehydrogenase subunit 1